MGWITSRHRKKHQRALNACVRSINKNIERDELWRGRFVIRQAQSRFYIFEDKSGGMLYVELVMIDKKTGRHFSFWENSNSLTFWNAHKLFEKMNWFIVEYCNVWEESDIRTDKTDYRKVPLKI